MMIVTDVKSNPCYLNFTKKALADIDSLFADHESFRYMSAGKKLSELLVSKEPFYVHLEKAKVVQPEELYVDILFDTTENTELMSRLPNKTLCLSGVVKDDGLLIISIRQLHKAIGQKNSRRLSTHLHFFINERNPNALPEDMINSLKEMPVSKEQSKIVKSHLESWQVYLDLLVERAAQEEVKMDFESARLTDNLRNLLLFCPHLGGAIEKKKLRNAEVTINWEEGEKEVSEKVGIVRRFIKERNLVEVELVDDFVELARQNKWSPAPNGEVHISNYGDLAQARRLRTGFRDLERGAAQNPNLENLLFDEDPLIDTTENQQDFEFTEAIQDNLNHYQREAVKGALAAEDLYLIQGPPGTGKTTVIAEICYQNAERGLKTLVASQSNLAVDNALSKLLSHTKVRILRKGRTNSIEEEGKKYIEENVAHTWKEQTKQSVDEDYKQLEARLQAIEAECQQGREQLLLNLNKKNQFEQGPVIQNELDGILSKLAINSPKLDDCRIKVKTLEKNINKLIKGIECNSLEMEKKRRVLENWDHMNEWENKNKLLRTEVESLGKQVKYLKVKSAHREKLQQMQQLQKSLALTHMDIDGMGDFILQQANYMDFNQLCAFISNRKDMIDSQLLVMKRKLSSYQRMKSHKEESKRESQHKLKIYAVLEEQIKRLVSRQESILERHGYDTGLARDLATAAQLTEDSVEASIQKLTNAIMKFTEPNKFQSFLYKITNKRPMAIEQLILQFTEGIGLQRWLENETRNLLQSLVELEKMETEFPSLFNEFKTKLISFYEKQWVHAQGKAEKLTKQLDEFTQEADQLYETLKKLRPKIGGMEESLGKVLSLKKEAEERLENLGSEEDYQSGMSARLKQIQYELKKDQASLQEMRSTLGLYQKEQDKLEIRVGTLNKEKKDKEKIIEYLGTAKMERELKLIDRMNQEITDRIDQLKRERVSIKQQIEIKKEWAEMLVGAKDYDLKEIKNLYIKHANVIGTTCVQSARKDFVDDYPDFDVVIIDEVSKATPPELLLPMLKGKKIILVGDHHQLPPLIGQETLDEVIDRIPDLQKKEEVQANLKESLFERLFKSLPEEYKTTLRIQYRMHEDIMDTIIQFYENRNDPTGYGLTCGLADSNAQRDHVLEGQIIKRGQHIMWFDLPNEEEFFEQQEAGTTSRYNPSELKIISAVLIDLNEAVQLAKKEGRMKADALKEVGITSFYGEQVRRLKQMVDDELDLPHLSCRIGTVDRFQGMERDVIIASFVRNHDHKNEDIGFSNDYRRLNVALSRAKELLVITGSAKMFTKKAKKPASRKMYQRVVDSIRLKNGMRDHLGRVK